MVALTDFSESSSKCKPRQTNRLVGGGGGREGVSGASQTAGLIAVLAPGLCRDVETNIPISAVQCNIQSAYLTGRLKTTRLCALHTHTEIHRKTHTQTQVNGSKHTKLK